MKMLRKLTAFFLALVIAAGLSLPVEASTAKNAVITVSDSYVNPLYSGILTEADLNRCEQPVSPCSEPNYLSSIEDAGLIMREGMKERSENITIYFQTPAFSDTYTQDDFKAQVREIADYALIHTGVPTEGDYLRWQYGGWKYENATAQSAEVGGETVYQWTIPFTFTYYTTLDQEQEVDGTVEELLQSWDLSDAPDYLKLRTIYDYICEHVTYDHDHVNDSSYKLQYTAYAALENGTAVCQGYAVLLYRLSLELEVDCRLIAGTGNTDPHGWNIAQLNDLYYNLDSTWDAGSSEYKYFLKCEENFGSHTRDDEYNTERFHADYPMSDTDYTPTAGDTCRSHHYESEVTTEATCTTDGTITYTCPNCGDTYEETIPMTGHSWGDWVQTTAPTCTDSGVESRSCANCDAVETREVEALGHSWDDGVVTKEPTEEETGIRTYTCETCGETKTEEIPVLEHSRSVHRISGETRYETAYATADELKEALGVEKFDTIVVASGTDFPDALAGSYLATEKNAPILLTQEKRDSEVVSYIKENLSADGQVYILGGTVAVSQAFEDGLKEAGVSYERLAGDTRYQTDLEILEEAGLNGKEILVCTGNDFADSLSASATNLPILLVNNIKGELTEDQIAYLESLKDEGITFYIIGGTAAVSADLEAMLKEYGTVERVSGDTREETSVKVAEKFFDDPYCAALAYSRNFPDGLCGGALAYNQNGPILLVNAGKESYAADYVENNSVDRGIVFGGTAALSDDSVRVVFDLSEDEPIH